MELVNNIYDEIGKDKPTYVPLAGADHEDKVFITKPSMGFV